MERKQNSEQVCCFGTVWKRARERAKVKGGNSYRLIRKL